VKEALTTAGERRVDVVILRLNTPGGLATSMREMIADVLGSSVPVIGYVAPSGAHAASAGTYILFATHIAAMAPGTNLGAATPVQIGGPLPGLPGSAPDKDGKDKKDDARQPALKDAMTAKATNDAKHELDELLAERDRLNADIQGSLDQQTDAWGIKVTNVEIKHVDLNENMIRAIAKQAEAERLRRAKVINAAGEQQAAEKLVEAGRLLAREPQAMQLRYFAALHDIASERSSTIVFPLPTDLLTHLVPRPEGAK
jgi:membrane-bound ClpP family serine protease